MKHTKEWNAILAIFFLAATLLAQCNASPVSPKFPSTLNAQGLNGVAVPTNETDWQFEMTHLDMAICSSHLSGLRARNSDIYLIQYELFHTALADDTSESAELQNFCATNGYDPENAFLHYYDNTTVTYPDGRSETIPGWGGGSASSRKDARVKGQIWGSYRYMYNPKSDVMSAFKGYLWRKVITTGDKPDGIFVDECNPFTDFVPAASSGGHIVEYNKQTRNNINDEYSTDIANAFGATNELLGHDHPVGDRWLFPNVAEYVSQNLQQGMKCDGLITEIWIQEIKDRCPYTYDVAKQLADAGKIMVIAQATYAPMVSDVGNYSSAMDRHQMHALTEYWIAKQGQYTYYAQCPSDYVALSQFWCKSREYDVGTPVDSLYSTWQSGTDSAGQSFKIYKREYTKALMLSRPVLGWPSNPNYGVKTQQYTLPGTFRLLHYDGTLGPEITSIGLCMGEAITLVKSGSTTPPSDTTAPVISNVHTSSIASNSATIAWTTNEAATAIVSYGTTTSYGSSVSMATSTTSGSVTLSGLAANTTYHCKVTATDAAGNSSSSSDYTFTTSSTTDTTPPVISGVTAGSITASSATITWTTNEAASGVVDYGTTTSYGTQVASSALATSKSVSLTGLSANTTYHYRVSSTDASGNKAVSGDYSLTTLSADSTPVTAPLIKKWALLGPFAFNSGSSGLDTDYIGEATAHPSPGDTSASKTWFDYTSTMDYVDFVLALGYYTNADCYANTYIYSPTSQSAVLKLGSDDGVKVILNGATVWKYTQPRKATLDEDTVNINLKAGWNQLLCKVENIGDAWRLYARICDSAGNAIQGMQYSTTYTAPATADPQITVSISTNKTSAKPGDQITYTVTYRNNGSGDASEVVLSADVDANVNFVSASGGGQYDSAAKLVRWNIGTVAAGASSSLTYIVSVK